MQKSTNHAPCRLEIARTRSNNGCLKNLQPTDGVCEQYTHKYSTYKVAFISEHAKIEDCTSLCRKQLSSTCHVSFLAAPHKHKFSFTHFIHFSCLSDGLTFTNKPKDSQPFKPCDVPRESGRSTQIPFLTP